MADRFLYKIECVSREGIKQEFFIWETAIDLFEKAETLEGATYDIQTGEFLY
jgi:hypothetical protein